MGIEVPVRATTATLFFFAAAIALYFSPEQPALLPLAKGSFLFFTALGPIHWVQEMVFELPWRTIPGPSTDAGQLPPTLHRIGDTLTGRYTVEWPIAGIRVVLLGIGTWYAYSSLWLFVQSH